MREELQTVLNDYLEAIDKVKSREEALFEEVDRNLGSEDIKKVIDSLIEHVKQRPEEIKTIDEDIRQENIENAKEMARSGLVYSEKPLLSDIIENDKLDGPEKLEQIGRFKAKSIPELNAAYIINEMSKEHEKHQEFFKGIENAAKESPIPNVKQFASELFEKNSEVGKPFGINDYKDFTEKYDKELDRRDYQGH